MHSRTYQSGQSGCDEICIVHWESYTLERAIATHILAPHLAVATRSISTFHLHSRDLIYAFHERRQEANISDGNEDLGLRTWRWLE